MNSRRKGKVGEREARDVVRCWWFASDCIRAAQSNGKHSADLLYAGEGVHVEVKRRRRIQASDFMAQAVTDARKEEFPVVLMREDNGGWMVMFRVEDSLNFSRMVQQNKETFDAAREARTVDSGRSGDGHTPVLGP